MRLYTFTYNYDDGVTHIIGADNFEDALVSFCTKQSDVTVKIEYVEHNVAQELDGYWYIYTKHKNITIIVREFIDLEYGYIGSL